MPEELSTPGQRACKQRLHFGGDSDERARGWWQRESNDGLAADKQQGATAQDSLRIRLARATNASIRKEVAMGKCNFTLPIVVNDELALRATGKLHLVTPSVRDYLVLASLHHFA